MKDKDFRSLYYFLRNDHITSVDYKALTVKIAAQVYAYEVKEGITIPLSLRKSA